MPGARFSTSLRWRRRESPPAQARALTFASNHVPAVAFGTLWILGIALAHIHVLKIQSDWSATVYGAMAFTLLAVVCGTVVGERIAARVTHRVTAIELEPDRGRLRGCALCCLIVGYAELVYRFVAAGTVPLFSADIDTARFALPGGPMVVLRDGLIVAAVVAASRPRRLWSRDALPDLAIAATALAGFALEGARTPVFMPIAAAFLARSLRFGLPPVRRLAIGAGVLGLVASALFYVRTAQHPDTAFGAELYDSIVPGTPWPLLALLPLYIALVTNFEALARVVEHFPAAEPFAHGAFNGFGYDAVLPGTREIATLSAQISPSWTTSTMAGTLWADAGFLGIAIGGIVVGALVGGAVAVARRTRSLGLQLAAGYLLFLLLFGFYTNMFTQYPDWLIVTPLLILVGQVAAPSPGVRRRSERYSRGMLAVRKTVASLASRPGFLYPAAALLGLVVVGLILTTTLPDRQDAITPVPVTAVVDLPSVATDARTVLATDGDNYSDNEPLWAIRVAGDVARVTSIGFAGGRPPTAATQDVPLRGPPPDGVDVTHWNGPNGGSSLITTSFERNSLRTTVYDLRTKRLTVVGSVPLPKLDAGVTRTIAVATVSAGRPDVIVIDRGSTRARVLVNIVSGESAFSAIETRTRLPFRGFAPNTWPIDFGRQRRGSIDLMAFHTDAANLRHTEIHVAGSDAAFQRFYFDRELSLPAKLPPGTRILSGQYEGAPAVYAVYRTEQPRVLILPLAAPVRSV